MTDDASKPSIGVSRRIIPSRCDLGRRGPARQAQTEPAIGAAADPHKCRGDDHGVEGNSGRHCLRPMSSAFGAAVCIVIAASAGHSLLVLVYRRISGRLLMMQIPVEVQRRSQGMPDPGIALVGIGSMTIGILNLGILGTLAVASITIVVGFGGLRLFSAWWRRRKIASTGGESLLIAWASLDRDSGVLTVTSDTVMWAGKSSETVYSEGEIEKATIRPLPLIGAAELRLLTAGGCDVLINVTAPARTIERALSSG